MTEVTAILAIRNEAAVLGACLRHLVRNGVRIALIDNGSDDDSPRIYGAPEFASHLVEVQRLPFTGAFSLEAQLSAKHALAERLGGGWIIHLDADEMMHSYRPGETLAAAFARIGAAGWNAVNFDEFVFLPIERDYPGAADGFPDLHLYYLHEPGTPRLMRAWRTGSGLSMQASGGHHLEGADLRLAPESFALRHYMFRSQAHAYEKYPRRAFERSEIDRGWHTSRVGQPRERYRFPAAEQLKRLADVNDRRLDKSDPWSRHYWMADPRSLRERLKRVAARVRLAAKAR
ncbi:MAG TPA: glycosyltransferase family 2 protein [Caulobacteraceae bacterium]|nr:glycosyltransferase family 2 protein [Caulobacteraceae bacterium]